MGAKYHWDGCAVRTTVSIHTPVMGANWSLINSALSLIVSIHTPVMGAKVNRPKAVVAIIVSIHTPVMGANFMSYSLTFLGLFQSTHPWWVRIYNFLKCDAVNPFQSTHPWWVRKQGDRQHRVQQVSIHTPVMGANLTRRLFWYVQSGFNPHTRDGCEAVKSAITIAPQGFNPHTRDGCETAIASTPLFTVCFNPHTRDGCENVIENAEAGHAVSIHTPVMGANAIGIWRKKGCYRFNPHTRDGCERW